MTGQQPHAACFLWLGLLLGLSYYVRSFTLQVSYTTWEENGNVANHVCLEKSGTFVGRRGKKWMIFAGFWGRGGEDCKIELELSLIIPILIFLV